MSLEDLPEETILYISNKLEDKDILSLSVTSKKYNDLIRAFFKECIVILTSWKQPVLLIEKNHPNFKDIIKSQKSKSGYIYYRFLTSYNNFILTYFKYRLAHRSLPTDPRRFAPGEYQKYLAKRMIGKGELKYICPNKEVAIQLGLNNIQTRVLDVLKEHNFVLYEDNSDCDSNPKTGEEIIAQAMTNMNKNSEANWDVDGNDTFFHLRLISLQITDDLTLYMKGYWNGILNIHVTKEYLTELNKDGSAELYVTHDNGGRPFVVAYKDSNVYVFKQDPNEDNTVSDITTYTIPVIEYKGVKRFLPGIEPNPQYNGNSVLVDLGNGRYVFIGQNIYEFDIEKRHLINDDDGQQDQIVEYHSLIGNSNVPYPVAISNSNAYFMLDYKYIPKSEFPEGIDWSDSYSYFYGHLGPKVKRTQTTLPGLEIVHGRIW